ncbi:MAG: CAP domain-containing protein [Saprospiraceae bacterium]
MCYNQKFNRLHLFLLLASFLSCSTTTPQRVQQVEGTIREETFPPSPAGFATEILDEINAFRRSGYRCGARRMVAVPPLAWNEQLADAALRHARDMAQHNHFSHTGTDGSTSGERTRAAGYNWSTVGENIAYGYPDIKSAVKGWMESTGHCKNIMNPDFKEMGAAAEGQFWSQTLGARR